MNGCKDCPQTVMGEWKPRDVSPIVIDKVVASANSYQGPNVSRGVVHFFMTDPVFDNINDVKGFLVATLPDGDSVVKLAPDDATLKAASWAASVFPAGSPAQKGIIYFINKFWPMGEWQGKFLAYRADAENYVGVSKAKSGELTYDEEKKLQRQIMDLQRAASVFQENTGKEPLKFRIALDPTEIRPETKFKPRETIPAPPMRAGFEPDTGGGVVGRVLVVGGLGVGLYWLLTRKKKKRR